MPGQITKVPMPGRTIEEGAGADQGLAPRIIAAAKARATLTVTDTIDSLASNVGAQVKGRVRALSAG